MTLKFIAWDVEHGSAAYIRTPNNKHVVIDLGAKDATGSNFSPLKLLSESGLNSLDLLVITHPHLDHIEDILNLDLLPPNVLIRPKHLDDDDIWIGDDDVSIEIKEIFEKYLDISRNYTNPVSSEADPTLPSNFGDVSFQFFTPCRSPRQNLNNHSVVTVMTYAGIKFLIPGDNEGLSWQELLGNARFVEAISNTHVFVASHHGRSSGYCEELFVHIRPVLTIISDGRAGNTSVTEKYTAVSRGYNVETRRGGWEERKCVTTRSDGYIEIEVIPRFGQTGHLSVKIN